MTTGLQGWTAGVSVAWWVWHKGEGKSSGIHTVNEEDKMTFIPITEVC